MRASEIANRQVRDVDDGGRVLWIERAKTRKGDRHLEVPEVLRGPLLDLCKRKDGKPRDGEDRLFGDVDRHWVGYHVRRLCRAAKVPEVCPHGLRGTMASIAVQAVPAEHVAAALGQTGPAVTRRHYLANGAEQRGRGKAALKILKGGKP
jgi:integrase